MQNRTRVALAGLYGAVKSLKASNQPRSLWWSVPLWTGAAALLLTAALYGMDHTVKAFLKQDADHTALQYADFIGKTVPDLDRLFTQRELSQRAQSALQRSSQLGDVFRFKLFDANGQLLLTSDQIDSMAQLETAGASQFDAHHGDTSEYVSGIVMGGNNYIELADGRQKPDRPDLYSEAYVLQRHSPELPSLSSACC